MLPHAPPAAAAAAAGSLPPAPVAPCARRLQPPVQTCDLLLVLLLQLPVSTPKQQSGELGQEGGWSQGLLVVVAAAWWVAGWGLGSPLCGVHAWCLLRGCCRCCCWGPGCPCPCHCCCRWPSAIGYCRLHPCCWHHYLLWLLLLLLLARLLALHAAAAAGEARASDGCLLVLLLLLLHRVWGVHAARPLGVDHRSAPCLALAVALLQPPLLPPPAHSRSSLALSPLLPRVLVRLRPPAAGCRLPQWWRWCPPQPPCPAPALLLRQGAQLAGR